jgi:hypothetical protein
VEGSFSFSCQNKKWQQQPPLPPTLQNLHPARRWVTFFFSSLTSSFFQPELDLPVAALQSMPCFSRDVQVFYQCFEKLSYDNDEAKALRRKEWSTIDCNGNGQVSLAELTRWIKTTLINVTQNGDEGERLYRHFYPCYIRSFLDAADAGVDRKIKGMKSTEDDFIQKGEFRLMASYLCIYSLMFETFTILDGSREASQQAPPATVFRMAAQTAPITDIPGDRRITVEEWSRRCPTLGTTPFVGLNAIIENPEYAPLVFQEMDADGKGAVLLTEYCRWLKKKEIDFDTPFGRLLRVGDDFK